MTTAPGLGSDPRRPDAVSPGLSRRTLLRTSALGIVAAVAGVSVGCGAERPRPAGGPLAATGSADAGADAVGDVGLVVAAIDGEASLGSFAAAAERRHDAAAGLLRGLASTQTLHVARLRASLRGARPDVVADRPRVPAGAAALTAELADLATAARDARWSDSLNAVSPGLAALFAAIGGSHAQTVALVTPETASVQVPTPGSLVRPAALQRCLAAEHAAVYGYALLGGVLDAGDSESADGARAVSSYDVHRARRDLLVELITAAGTTPVAAEASYRLPVVVSGGTSAARLARTLEQRCAAVYGRAVAFTSGEGRLFAVRTLADCAVRGLAWGSSPSAFPGLAA